MTGENGNNDFYMTPWEVKGKIDYTKLVKEFGTELIDRELRDRMVKHTGEEHFLLRRGIYFSHRDMNWVIDELEKGNPFYLYNGRGPSANIHMGHYVQFMFTKWLQDKFKCPFYFQLTDDEKFLFNQNLESEETTRLAYENALDLIAMGFDPDLTDIIIDTKHSGIIYPLAIKVAKKITFSTCKAVFGFTNSSNIGQIFYTSFQAVPAFLHSVRVGKKVPCVIPLAIDQDAHFRVTRDVITKLGYYKPAILHSIFLPGLQQSGSGKMSASDPGSALYTVDDPETIKKKLRGAFTGGKDTAAQQRIEGGNPDICPIFWHYKMVFMPDDTDLSKVEQECRKGEILCGECKNKLIGIATKDLAEHQKKREKARDKVDDFLLKM